MAGDEFGDCRLATGTNLRERGGAAHINYVAQLLDEDEDWLLDLSIHIFREDGCLHVYGGR